MYQLVSDNPNINQKFRYLADAKAEARRIVRRRQAILVDVHRVGGDDQLLEIVSRVKRTQWGIRTSIPQRPIEAETQEALEDKRGAPQGNQNARLGEHGSITIRLPVSAVDLLYDFFAMGGNMQPSRREIRDAVTYAVQQVYGPKDA